ncbi:hypothetical protein ACFV9W_31505 [Streptomyces sp. NPDC059897]|uniref:hypothetical protein n=1 Tax=Streptomyces sp. NPDC059897 TaxID=3346994 RepID=UPI003649A88F
MAAQNRSEYEASLELGTSLANKGRFHDAVEPLLRAAALGVTAAQRRAAATALLRLGMGLGERHGFVDALRVDRRAAVLFAELGDEDAELQCRFLMGVCDWQLNAFESAIQTFETIAGSAAQKSADRDVFRPLAVLSITCVLVDHLRQYRRAIPYATEAARLYRSAGNDEQAAHALRHLDEARRGGNV